MNESIYIQSTLHAIDRRDYQCAVCLNQYRHHSEFEKMTRNNQQRKACDFLVDKPIHRIGKTLEFRTCIGNFWDHGVVSYLEMYHQYEKGVMPFGGAMADQPNKVIDIFRTMANYSHGKMEQDKQRADLERAKKLAK